MSTVIWFRDDLRLTDHAALTAGIGAAAGDAAREQAQPVIALFILDEVSPETRPLGGAARWWLHESLTALGRDLAARGIPLVLRRGPAATVLPEVVRESQARHVYWNRRYGSERHIDARLKRELREAGTDARSFPGGLLYEPWTVATGEGSPYRVYTPFWRACLKLAEPAAPLPAPALPEASADSAVCAATTAAASGKVAPPPWSDALNDWALQPTRPDWAGGLRERWTPGEQAALERLERFLAGGAHDYASRRDFPADDVGSELSPHLRWGEISPRTVWHAAVRAAAEQGADVGTFLSEAGWREFAWHTTFHHTQQPPAAGQPARPDAAECTGSLAGLHMRELNPQFAAFPWRDPAPGELEAWQRGETGFGLVDAGMRELWQTGFMHNRVRMVAASFLTKNLLVDWRIGEGWFWDTLVDADAASNPFNWQWVAGSGADAAPYFRVFNPRTQQQKFDPDGHYVTLWAPESVMLPELVDLRETRVRALAAYDQARHTPPAATDA